MVVVAVLVAVVVAAVVIVVAAAVVIVVVVAAVAVVLVAVVIGVVERVNGRNSVWPSVGVAVAMPVRGRDTRLSIC